MQSEMDSSSNKPNSRSQKTWLLLRSLQRTLKFKTRQAMPFMEQSQDMKRFRGYDATPFAPNEANYTTKNRVFRDDDLSSADLMWRTFHLRYAMLKYASNASELIAGIAMVAMLEFQVNIPSHVPEELLIMFSINTTLLVAVHVFALAISTYIQPQMQLVECLASRVLIDESPHDKFRNLITLVWACSIILGIFLFLFEVILLTWIKFLDYSFIASLTATVIMVPVLVTFLGFAFHFYHELIADSNKLYTAHVKK